MSHFQQTQSIFTKIFNLNYKKKLTLGGHILDFRDEKNGWYNLIKILFCLNK